MQNSVSDGAPFEGATTSYGGQDGPALDPPAPGYNAEAPAFSYDEVFPALSQTPTPTLPNAWNNRINNKMRVGTSNISKIFVISQTEMKMENDNFGGGGRLKECTSIMHLTNTKIEFCTGKDNDLSFVVTGKPTDVAEAHRRIVQTFQTPVSTTVTIPKDFHSKLLGKGGSKLKELEAATCCKISVPNKETISDTISVSGPRAGVEKAVHELKSTYDILSRQANEKITVPRQYHPFICGVRNKSLIELMAETNTKIYVNNDEMTIAGETEGVATARDRILAAYRDMDKKFNTVLVEVPKQKHRYIIGYKGATINDILQDTGVSVEMPPLDSTVETITLRGPQDKLGQALTVVCEKANSVDSVSLDVPAWLHKRLRGKGNVNLSSFLDGPNKIIASFKDDTVRIEGPPEDVEKLRAHLERETKEYLKRYVFEEIKADSRFIKHIIGKGGANVNRLKEGTETEIDISEEDGTVTLKIDGPPDEVKKLKATIQEKFSQLENEKEVDVIIDQKHRPNIIGKNGERIRAVRDKFNVQIIIPNQGQDGDIVKVRGQKKDVDECATHLKKLCKELEAESFRMKVAIHKQNHKFIIGKSGATIRKIREETNTKIDLPNENDLSNDIWITGREENVRQAKVLIEKIQNEMANIVTKDITIPQKFHNSLIGARGRLIQAISDECGGVQIKFPNADSKSDKVTVQGTLEDVEKAIQQLNELKDEREASSFTAEIRANPMHHRYLIGKKGQNVNRLRTTTGARIVFPTEEDTDTETITIIGKQDQVEAAKLELEKMLATIQNTVEDNIIIHPDYHRHFLARSAAVVNQISEEFGGVEISFPRANTNSDRVTIKGGKEFVESAKKRMEEVVKDLESHITVEVSIPNKHHRSVMGKGGSRVKALSADYNVQIKFPDRLQSDNDGAEVNGEIDIVRVTGHPDNCERVKEELLASIPVSIQVPVKIELHRQLIGRAGENVRRLQETFDVRIITPPAEQQSEIITIVGKATACEEAKQAILADLEEIKKEKELRSFSVELDIEQEYHKTIIGRRGENIRRIRENFDIEIQLPDRDSVDNNKIVISGYEEKVLAAKEEILSLVNERKNRIEEEVEVDSRVQGRLIGPRGKKIKQFMEKFGVDVRFPRRDDPNPNLVIISGTDMDNVLDAKDEIQNLAEEYSDNLTSVYRPPQKTGVKEGKTAPKGFVVSGGPWETGPQQTPDTASITDFPSFGAQGQGPQLSSWGPRH